MQKGYGHPGIHMDIGGQTPLGIHLECLAHYFQHEPAVFVSGPNACRCSRQIGFPDGGQKFFQIVFPVLLPGIGS